MLTNRFNNCRRIHGNRNSGNSKPKPNKNHHVFGVNESVLYLVLVIYHIHVFIEISKNIHTFWCGSFLAFIAECHWNEPKFAKVYPDSKMKTRRNKIKRENEKKENKIAHRLMTWKWHSISKIAIALFCIIIWKSKHHIFGQKKNQKISINRHAFSLI